MIVFMDTLLSILGILGIGSVIAAFFTYFWQTKKEVQLKENELKEKRYRCTLLLMYALINPKELKALREIRPDIRDLPTLKRELQVEWVSSWIFANDETIKAFKGFLSNPSEETFAKTAIAMKKELWGKSSKLPISIFSIDPTK